MIDPILYFVVGLAVVALVFVLSSSKKKRGSHWADGLLASDQRSFETICKQHQRTP